MGDKMGNPIIAEKFALLRTKGSNGIACTHLVEDTFTTQKAIVKISDQLGLLSFEYLKAINLIGAQEVPGILLPFEGGLLEEETGYYFAFPELGEPSLENFLRIGVPFTSEEALQIVDQTLSVLEKMHEAGLLHLFINTRNIFYRPNGSVTLKDPALKVEFFQPLLELIAAPDFSYFSPQVMDGQVPDARLDIYATGRLAERVLEEVRDKDSLAGASLKGMGERCQGMGVAEEPITSAGVREMVEACEACEKQGANLGLQRENATKQIEIIHECVEQDDQYKSDAEKKLQSGNGLLKAFLRTVTPMLLIAVLALGSVLVVRA